MGMRGYAVRVVFDNYHEISLQNHTREGRGKTSHSRQFVIEDRTIIGMGVCKCHTLFNNLEVFYLVSVNITTSGNIDSPLNHSHEEANICIIRHCIHTTNKLSADHDTAIIVWTPDSDVVPLLVRFHDKNHSTLLHADTITLY